MVGGLFQLPGVTPSNDGSPRKSGLRITGICPFKRKSFFRHPVESRRVHLPRPISSQMRITGVIRNTKQYIRLLYPLFLLSRTSRKKNRQRRTGYCRQTKQLLFQTLRIYKVSIIRHFTSLPFQCFKTHHHLAETARLLGNQIVPLADIFFHVIELVTIAHAGERRAV